VKPKRRPDELGYFAMALRMAPTMAITTAPPTPPPTRSLTIAPISNHCHQDLTNHAAADRPADGVAGLAHAEVFQHIARRRAAEGPGDDLDDEIDQRSFHGTSSSDEDAAAHPSP
jgi:hypothetical protein